MKKLLFSFLAIISLLVSCWEEVGDPEDIKEAPKFLNKTLQIEGALNEDSSIFIWAYINGEVENYQWYKNNVLLNSNYDTLFIDSLNYDDTGSYVLIVSNNGGGDTSNIYRLVLSSDISEDNSKPVFIQSKPDSQYTVTKGTSLTIPFAATDSDSADTNLFYWINSTSIPISADTAITDSNFTWYTDSIGDFSLTINVTDNKDTVSKEVLIKVTKQIINDTVNNVPQFVSNKPALSYNVNKGSSLKIPFAATDVDISDSNLTFWTKATNFPANSDTGTVDTFFIWNTDSIGNFELVFYVTDGKDTATKTVAIEVSEISDDTTNSVPVFVLNKPALSYNVIEGNPLVIPFKATDEDVLDNIIYWISTNNLPASSDTSSNDSQFVWSTPVLGEYSITVYATDNKDTTKVIVGIKVEEQTSGPSLTIDGYSKGQFVEVNENDTLKLSLSITINDSEDSSGFLVDTILENGGTLPTGLSGDWIYKPSYNVASIKNPVDTAQISFIASSVNHDADTFNLTILIKNVNRIPTANSSIVAAIEEEMKNISVSISDEDGDSLSWLVSKNPTNGILSVDSGVSLDSISISYTSKNLSSAFNDNFELTITDGADTITETVSIVVNADNDAPVITGQVNDTFQLIEGIPFTLTIDSINVSDPDDDLVDLTFTIESGVGYTINGSSITVENFSTSLLEIIVSVKDDQNATDLDTLIAKVTEVNDVPVINGNGTVQWYEDNTLDLSTVYFNITDSDDNSHTTFAVSGTNYTVDESGNLITPKENWDDTISVNVKATDGKDTSEIYIAKLNVIAVNDTPVITIDTPTEGPAIDFGGTFHIPITVEDPDGIKKLEVTRGYSEEIFTNNGNFTSGTIPWTPVYKNDIIGTNTIRVKVTDSSDVQKYASIDLTVRGTWITDSIAVQVILDTNNYNNQGSKSSVQSVSVIEGNRIKKLTFQQTGFMSAFTILPKDIGNVSTLRSLYIFNNNITSGMNSLGLCTSLDSLTYRNSQNTTSLTYQLGYLDNLTYLNLTQNSKLASIPSGVCDLPNLKVLDISHCVITSLPSNFKNLTSLDTLNCGYNDLTSLPLQVGDLSNLTNLDLYTFLQNKLHPSEPAEDWALWLDSYFSDGREGWYKSGSTQK